MDTIKFLVIMRIVKGPDGEGKSQDQYAGWAVSAENRVEAATKAFETFMQVYGYTSYVTDVINLDCVEGHMAFIVKPYWGSVLTFNTLDSFSLCDQFHSANLISILTPEFQYRQMSGWEG